MSFSENDPRLSVLSTVGLEKDGSLHQNDPWYNIVVNKKLDNVNHPNHYQGKFEVIDIIEDYKLNFNLGNLIKYVLRAGKKDPTKHIEDLEKAKWYLEREIANLKKL